MYKYNNFLLCKIEKVNIHLTLNSKNLVALQALYTSVLAVTL